jgi:pre-rRNA-processing protein RIX1
MNTSNTNVRNKKNYKPRQPSANADSFLAPSTLPSSSSHNSDPFPGLRQAAHSLLPLILLNIPSQHLRFSLRSQVDRTAILTQHKEAMIASVLFPPGTAEAGKLRSSILPHLARSCPGDFEVEGLIRPRMPVIPTGKGLMNDVCEDEEGDEAEDYYSQGGPLQGIFTNDAGPSQLDTIPGLKPHSRDQDAQPPPPTSLDQRPEYPLPSSSSSKRFYDTTDPEGGEDQSNDHPQNFRRPHAPPSPKRLRVDPTTIGSGLGAQNSVIAHSSSTESPALVPPPRTGLSSSELTPSNAPAVHEPARSAAATQAGLDMDSDGEFEVPELVMDADTDEAEDMEEDGDGDGDG